MAKAKKKTEEVKAVESAPKPYSGLFPIGKIGRVNKHVLGWTKGDFFKVNGHSADGKILKCEFVSGEKLGAEFMIFEEFADDVAEDKIPASVK